MRERWHSGPSDAASGAEAAVARVIQCWACVELLALQAPTGHIILEADAEQRQDTPDITILVCGCGAHTLLATDHVHPSLTSEAHALSEEGAEHEP